MGWIDPVTKAVVPPIHMSSTYVRDEDNAYRSGRIYARADNPTFDQTEATLASLEDGAAALIFSSGMSAASACFLALSPGDHVVAPKVMYWALRSWITGWLQPWGVAVDIADMTDPAKVRAAVRPEKTRLIWVETPANPTWCVTDLAAMAEIARGAGARVRCKRFDATARLIVVPEGMGHEALANRLGSRRGRAPAGRMRHRSRAACPVCRPRHAGRAGPSAAA